MNGTRPGRKHAIRLRIGTTGEKHSVARRHLETYAPATPANPLQTGHHRPARRNAPRTPRTGPQLRRRTLPTRPHPYLAPKLEQLRRAVHNPSPPPPKPNAVAFAVGVGSV